MLASTHNIDRSLGRSLENALPLSGKMLRSRLGIQLFQAGIQNLTEDGLVHACAAVELVHTASLCHDDVIDNATIRRHKPTLWQTASRSGAVLIGDIMLCEALSNAMDTGVTSITRLLLDKVREVCRSEAEQELCLRTLTVTPDECLRIARGKTGPLFAFIGAACGGNDDTLASQLEESGYLIGTAYQLADDLVDAVGSQDTTGKTVGNDAERQKHTLAQEWRQTPEKLISTIETLSRRAISLLDAHPQARAAVEEYLSADMESTFNQLTTHVGIQWRLTA